ncbi:MAG: aldehyde dehydrogenase [Flavobacteriales bacterium]|jgi:aminomuconate-semialdehyde/2-hydroxymuconate-6-semialdehyde dehydrogenase
MTTLLNAIGGQFLQPSGGAFIDNISPITGEVYSRIPDSSAADVALAAEAADKAFPAWSAMSAADRSEIMLRIADLIAEHSEQLAQAESIDSGKPIQHSRAIDIPRAEANIRFFATAILHFHSESHHTRPGVLNYTNRKPIGVVGCISPWNLPLYLFTWKIAPALAAGNCVIAKPSEITPMTAFMFSELCQKAGLPPGVLNVIHGRGSLAGQALVDHPSVKAISFTGGTSTGAAIAASAAPKFKKLSLELGGKNPNIIFADCDYDKMLATTIHSSFSNQGQICLCGSRILVEASLYDRFLNDFIAKVSRIKPADPMNPDTKMGAVVSEAHMHKVLSYVKLAKEEGGHVHCGGEQVFLPSPLDRGYYVSPAVITGLGAQCRTNQEEIFGPVVTVMPFSSEEEALIIANSTQYGLSATVWTSDLNRAHRMSAKIDSGIVWVNTWLLRDLRTPFGGVKNSGVGREGGVEALRFFTEAQNVCVEF